MKKALQYSFVVLAITAISSCSKSDDTTTDTATLKTTILADASVKVCTGSYEDMYSKSTALLNAVTTLNTTTTDANLTSCRQLWKDVRTTWEQSESWLFGPVSTNDIDPRIDTWPVDFNALDAILASSATLNEAYVDGLADALKGFHPIEYLLWGQSGTKTAAQLTAREKEFLLALAQNLNKLCKEVRDSWTTGGYATQLSTAGSGSVAYTSKLAAFKEIVDAMAGIADEVANAKISEPFTAQDPSLEESPFAKNSITDFTNNINGIMDMYQGKFISDGAGLEDLVRTYNLSLDNEIKTKHAAAIASLQAITVPFGQAITTQQTLVQNAITKINDLKTTIETKLSPFVLQYGQ
jgi:putative iron-regulated protein